MIHYNSHKWLTFLKARGSVLPWSSLYALLSASLAFVLKYADKEGWAFSDWQMMTNNAAIGGFLFTLSFMVVFRTSQCYSRFWACATGICEMRAEMCEAASGLMAFSNISQHSADDVDMFRHKLVRLFSLYHALCLCAICEQHHETYPIIDIESIPDKFLQHLKAQSEEQKPAIVYQWIETLLVKSLDSKLLTIAPPILSRTFQELEKTMTSYHQVLQVMLISFPFPYAQMSIMMIWLYALLAPFLMLAWVSEPIMSALYVFATVVLLFSLELTAAQLENPFGDDPNDFPTDVFQKQLNDHLLMLLEPASSWDFTLNEKVATLPNLKGMTTWHSFEDFVGKDSGCEAQVTAKQDIITTM